MSKFLPASVNVRRWVRAALVLFIILLWLNNVLYFWPEFIDDAFITLRHSLNAAEGRGLVYNPPERSEGHSSPVWALVHVVPFLLGWDAIQFSKILGLLLATLGIVVTALYTRRCGLRSPLIAAMILAAWTPIGFWAVECMETPLAFLVAIGVVYVHRLEVEAGRRIWFTALVLAVGFFVRPEAGLIVVPVILQHLLLLWPDWRRGLRIAFWPGVLCIGLVAWGTSLRFAYYGSVLANPSLVKMFGRGGNPEDSRGVEYVLSLFVHRPAVLVLLVTASLLAIRRNPRVIAVSYSGLAAWAYFGYLANGDWMPNFRFLVPGLPFYAVIIVSGWDGAMALRKSWRRYLATGAMIVLLVWFLYSESGYSEIRSRHDGDLVQMRLPRVALLYPKRFLRTGVQPGSRYYMTEVVLTVPRNGLIACHDIGFVGFSRPDVTVLDMVGLGDRQMAEMVAEGRVDRDFMPYFMQRMPDVVFIFTTPSGKGYFNTDRILLHEERFRENWVLKKRMPVHTGKLEIYVRKDLPLEQGPEHRVWATERMEELMPGWPATWVEYGEALAAAGRMEDARDVMLKVIEDFPASVRDNVLAARFFRSAGDFATSYRGFRNAAQYSVLGRRGRYKYLYPGTEYVFEEYLASLSRLKRYREALEEGELFLELVPDYPPVLWQMAYASMPLGREEEGAEYLRRAAESKRTDAKSQGVAGRAAEDLGDAHLQAGNRPEARRWYETAVGKYPDAADRDRVAKKLVDMQRQ